MANLSYEDFLATKKQSAPIEPTTKSTAPTESKDLSYDSFLASKKTPTPTVSPTITEPTIPPVVTEPKKSIFQKYTEWSKNTGKAIGNWEASKVLNFVESAKEKLATVGLYDYSKEYDPTKDIKKPTLEELKTQNATIGAKKHGVLDPFLAGIGDVEQVTGSTAIWLSKKLEASDSKLKGLKQISSGLGATLQQAGEEMQTKYTDVKAQQELGDFDWGDMMNPSWYHQNILRAIPFSLSLIPASLAAGSVGSAAGLGAFGTFVLSSILGGTTSRGLESATEAGTIYDELIKQGFSHEEADQKANEVFKKNMSLAGLDIGEFALTFMPGGKKIKSFLPKSVMSTGRVAFTGAMGGAEELLQKKFQDEAEGKTFSWSDPETKASAIIGSIMGGGLTTGALVVEGFKAKVLENLPNEMKGNGSTDDENLEAIAQQYPEETKKAVAEAVRETAKEEDQKIEAMSKIVEDVEEGLKTQPIEEVAENLREAGFNLKTIDTIISTVTSEDPTTIQKPNINEASQQALNEAGSTITEQPKHYSSAEEYSSENKVKQINAEAKDRKSKIEAIRDYFYITDYENETFEASTSSGTKVVGTFSDLSPETRQELIDSKKALDSAKGTGVENTKKAGDRYFKAQEVAINEIGKSKSQLEEIWNKAQGETKMKIKEELSREDKIKMSEIIKNLDTLPIETNKGLDFGDSELYFRLEELKEKDNSGEGLSEEEWLEVKSILGEVGIDINKGLDIKKTKEDNKTYGTSNKTSKGIDGEIQPNRTGVRRGNEQTDISSLEKRREGESTNRRTNDRNRNESTGKILLGTKRTKQEIKQVVSDFLPKATEETVNKIVSYYTRLDEAGYSLILDKQDINDYAYIQYNGEGNYTLTLNSNDINGLTINTLDHEIGTHIYYSNIGNDGRLNIFNGVKEVYKTNKKLFDNFSNWHQKSYWDRFVRKYLTFALFEVNPGTHQEIYKILQDTGFVNENNETIYPENIMESVFNFSETNDKLNNYLIENNYKTTDRTLEQNNMMTEEIVAYVVENAEEFLPYTTGELNTYLSGIVEDNLKFPTPNTLEFGGQVIKLKLKDSTKLTSADIIKKHANIQLKRDIVITDVYGEKVTLKAGEGITPYEVTGNKFILQDGEAYLVSKSQAQNVINNSKTSEAKPFAPELKQTEETVIGGKPKYSESDIIWKEVPKADLVNKEYKVYNGTLGTRKFVIQDEGDGFYVAELDGKLGKKVRNYTDAVEEINRFLTQEGTVTKYSSYTLPGGENYKEILIKAPDTRKTVGVEKIESIYDLQDYFGKKMFNEDKFYKLSSYQKQQVFDNPEYSKLHDKLKENKVVNVRVDITDEGIKSQEGAFKSSHWDEPNVISHIRMNERTYSGKKVAFMEELQSDWAREGRDKGFIDNKPVTYSVREDENVWVVKTDDGRAFDVAKTEASNGDEAIQYVKDNNIDPTFRTGATKVPYNPLLKNWQELSIKRALQEAVNTNAKYFAWINGPQTAARYNLSKQVDNIDWKPFNDGKIITINPIGGSAIEVFTDENGLIKDNIVGKNMPSEWKGKNIADAIGKGISEKIIQEKSGSLKGDGLNVGGSWASNLYDRQVRTIVENLTGQKVEMLDMGLAIGQKPQQWASEEWGTHLTYKRIETEGVGLEIRPMEGGEVYVVTDLLGDGKFKAMRKESLEDIDAYAILPKEEASRFNILWGRNQTTLTKEEKSELDDLFAKYDKAKKDPKKLQKLEATIYDISEKTTQQMGIELTPEVKAIVKGEAPQVKVSGKLPFTEQITAPVMFKLKAPEEKSLISLHNISIPSLSFAQRLGGFLINPSMAVIDVNKQGFDNYGEISLIGDTNLLSQGKTFASDIYSPRFPSLTIKIPQKGYDILDATFKKYEDIVDEKRYNLDMEDFDRTMSNSSLAMYDFLTKEGIEVPKTKQSGASHYDIKNGMREIILDRNLTSEFNNYIDRLKTNIGATSHIFKGYTYSGTRRYVPATVENISKDMRARGLANMEGMDYGLGSFRAKLVQKLPTIKKITEAKNRLVTTEEFEKTREEMNTRYSNLIEEYANKLKPGTGSSNPFINFDEVSQGLSDYVTGKFPEFLNRFTSVPQSLKDKTQQFIKEVKEMPTEYFESKFTRPVRLSEFKYAVIPDNTTEDIIRNLKNDGLQVITYKKGDETDRLNKIKELKQQETPLQYPVFFKIKLPEVNTGNKVEDTKQILKYVEKKLGVSSVVNSLQEKKALIEVAKETINDSPMKELEQYVADAGVYKGELPEVTGDKKEEIKKNKEFKGVKNEKALEFAQKGDVIVEDLNTSYGTNLDSEDARAEFEKYQKQKESIAKREKELKQQIELFGKTDTFKLIGQDKTLIGEITATRAMPEKIMEIMDQVKKEKKARREEVLNHPARPLMKYIDRKTKKLPKIGSKTAFGQEGTQILKDLKFDDIQEANKAIADYISKMDEFVNPISRLRLEERNAKFLRDKQKIMEEVEKKIRAEAKDRKSKIEAIRDYFYITDSELKEAIGDKDYRLLSEKEFEKLLTDIEEKALKIAEHAVAVSEVEWTIAQKELHRVENLQQAMEFPVDLNKMTTEQLNTLNETLGKYETGDVFLGVREIETLAKNAGLPDVKTQRQILEEVVGKRTGISIEKIKEITSNWFDKFRSAISLSRQNPFYEILVSDAYSLKLEASARYLEVERKVNELVKKARESRKQTFLQKLVPTDDMVIAYLEEGDLETRNLIAKDMSSAELELAHFIQQQYAEMRDFLVQREQLERIRENYYTHRPRGFLEAWLRGGVNKTPSQFVKSFASAFKETVLDIHKLDEATFKILDEQTSDILPLEKFFKYSMRRSGQLIPTKNLANAFLAYKNTFEMKRGLDRYIPRMEAVARALTPTETTEGGLTKDTSLERFVKEWINTQKGRPKSLGIVSPGDTLDSLIRSGVAFTRFLDLALRVPAQFMSLVGEEGMTWINIGTKRYTLGQYRAKTARGNQLIKQYEEIIGKSFWDKMKEQSNSIGNKIGETIYAFYGIATRNANIHHFLGSLTKEEFESGKISEKRLTEIKMEMSKWRADDMLSSVVGKTSIGAMFSQHKSWAIPILTQTLSNLEDVKTMVASGEYKTAVKSKQFGELFRATMLTLLLTLTILKSYKDLDEKRDRNLIEELAYKGMNDAFSFIAALSPKTLFTQPRLMSWIGDISGAVTMLGQSLATGERTASGEIQGKKEIIKVFTPKLFSELLKPNEQDKIMTSISTSTIKAQKSLNEINPEIVKPAQIAWDEVKKLGVGTEEADNLVNKLSEEEYTAYKLVKKSDTDYWTLLAEQVTPTVEEAYKVGFGTEEADELIKDLSKDEYEMYKKVKTALYGKQDEQGPSDWDKQSFVTHITNLARGWLTDPATAFNNLIHGDWKITKLKNGQIIVNRMPLDASQKVKEEAAKNNKNFKLDHTIPLEVGGTNRESNLNIITTEEWEENTPVENYLGKALLEGSIDGEEAREYIIRFKAGKGQILSDELMEEFREKYNEVPISFDQIKETIGQR